MTANTAPLIDVNTPGPLSPQQLAQFDQEGWVVADNVVDDQTLQAVIDGISVEIERLARKYFDAGKITCTWDDEPFETRLAKISEETRELALELWNGQLSNASVFNLIRHPRLLDVAEQFCGSEIIASAVYRLRPKLPSYDYGAVPWHQDSGYTEPYCDKAMMLTVWLPLVDANEENGCLWVLPGVHKRGIIEHAFREKGAYLIIPRGNLPQDHEAIPVPVKKGSVLLLHNLTPHASFENKTNRVRWSMDLRYQSAALPTNAKITRLEGEVGFAPDGYAPPACYPPEADFLVRSSKRPHEVVSDAADFHRLRTEHKSKGVYQRWSKVVSE